MSEKPQTESASELMGQRRLGIGNLAVPARFVGLEPGGTEQPE
jgi:hypothetical protein